MSVNSPLFLESYLDFKQHIEDVYKSLNTYEKGRKFSEFAKDILSTREAFWGLKAELNPKATHDGGWDIRWINSETDEAEIHCESKLNIDGQETLGSIIDKFSALESNRLSNQPNVIQMELDFGSLGIIGNTGNNQEKPEIKYCIVTLSSVKNIEKRYATSAKKSVEFYKHRNIFISDYASIKFDEIRKAYPNEEDKKYLIRVISSLLVKANEVFDNLKFQYPAESNDEDSQAQTGKIFNRFYTNEKGYKSYLIIFAICCMLNISNEEKFKVKSVKEIIEKINLVIGEKEQD
jgi:hypothetical protein